MTMKNLAPPGYVSMDEYAKATGVSRNAVEYRLHAGKLPYVKIGGRRFVLASGGGKKDG